ncbi:hypothetical protein CC99x_006000 [Candidatus Berkiella cookevillensis]|uniref:Glycosyl transferase family 2 n=1 Tax=Candidatus Berkiella cookevillensis TaxID=437022 RepID=A0A0Q9YHA1_9GAMM|nr:hypothetical protein [Candidatus Berkiella cookevillensis]MCS5708457.1 hypothetical protein [Candidatus Berkiella cookevillensis]
MTDDDKPIKILIATPCYQGMCHADYTLSLVKTFAYFQNKKNIKIAHKFILYDSLVPRARNYFSAMALSDKTITHLLFIDADIGWLPEDIMRLISHNKPIIGAAIAKKKYIWDKLRNEHVKQILLDDSLPIEEYRNRIRACLVEYAVNFGASREIKDGVLEVEHIGTAFMLIQRQALEKLCQHYPELKIRQSNHELLSIEALNHFYCLFELRLQEGRYLSEDFSFCKRWNDLGGKIYADLSISLMHHGAEDYYGSILGLDKTNRK